LAATSGGVEEAGAQGRQGVIAAGAGSQTPIHGLGDGATWITDQAQLPFGTQGQYLVDFYHLGDYLSAAADALAPKDKPAWREEKKTWLQENGWKDVLRNLEPALEPEHAPDAEAPVRACHRYMLGELAASILAAVQFFRDAILQAPDARAARALAQARD
jgi:hypothetical protein